MNVVRALAALTTSVVMAAGLVQEAAAIPLPPTQVQVHVGSPKDGVVRDFTYITLSSDFNRPNGGSARAGDYSSFFGPGLEFATVPESPARSMLGFAAIGIAGVKLRRRSVAAVKADRGRRCPPEERLVDVGRLDRFLQRSGRGLSDRKLPYRLPVRDSL